MQLAHSGEGDSYQTIVCSIELGQLADSSPIDVENGPLEFGLGPGGLGVQSCSHLCHSSMYKPGCSSLDIFRCVVLDVLCLMGSQIAAAYSSFGLTSVLYVAAFTAGSCRKRFLNMYPRVFLSSGYSLFYVF